MQKSAQENTSWLGTVEYSSRETHHLQTDGSLLCSTLAVLSLLNYMLQNICFDMSLVSFPRNGLFSSNISSKDTVFQKLITGMYCMHPSYSTFLSVHRGTFLFIFCNFSFFFKLLTHSFCVSWPFSSTAWRYFIRGTRRKINLHLHQVKQS